MMKAPDGAQNLLTSMIERAIGFHDRLAAEMESSHSIAKIRYGQNPSSTSAISWGKVRFKVIELRPASTPTLTPMLLK
ncbi:MAG: hypothetical protein PHE55_12735 [Methylococcaceae bacterium]|nr:hypothetical protein [Methylococcaceae bacterium]